LSVFTTELIAILGNYFIYIFTRYQYKYLYNFRNKKEIHSKKKGSAVKLSHNEYLNKINQTLLIYKLNKVGRRYF